MSLHERCCKLTGLAAEYGRDLDFSKSNPDISWPAAGPAALQSPGGWASRPTKPRRLTQPPYKVSARRLSQAPYKAQDEQISQ